MIASEYRKQIEIYASKNYEIEAIFNEIGFYQRVNSLRKENQSLNVSLQKWNQLLNFFNLNQNLPENTIDYISGDLRKTVTTNQNTAIYIRKEKTQRYLINDYPLRINVKNEIPNEPFEIKADLIRNKTRYTYNFSDGPSKVDLTKVISTTNNSQEITYEVELELGQSLEFGIDPVTHFFQKIEYILKVVLDTEHLYKISERVRVTDWYNRNFSTNKKNIPEN